ncbi:sensor histidine kinase [Spirosoma arcticum]
MFPFLPKNRFYRHGLFWLVVAAYFFIPQWIYPDYIDTVTHYYVNRNGGPFDYQHSPYFLTILFLNGLDVGMLYAYAFLRWAMPPLLNGRYGTGLGLYLLITVVVCYVARIAKGLHMAVIDPLLQGKPFRPFDSRYLDDYFFDQVYIHEYSTIILVLAVYKFFTNWRQKQQEANRLEREKISTEIQLIKTQVNPDFVFSSLNELDTLIRQKSKQAPELVLKLARLLRYVLYESQAELVPLAREVAMIEHYVCLQRIIHPTNLEVSFTVRGHTEDHSIAPSSLFPIVENAFQQLPVEQPDEPAWVSIDLAINETHLTLKVINGQTINQPDEAAWLVDVQKQLHFYYEESFDLQVRSDVDAHIISLTLPLSAVPQPDLAVPKPLPENGLTTSAVR